ncbi:flavodoxin [Methanoculleus taiwanensis]|uniref:Flavodoxin n=1 Tax=Methanoculleus taiwanensis TaxID=1550565 RepID=A0A498H0T1_9EURY|nr:flavodoxin family protein [Methanoculleus taiwanensis]RXE56253.1 flavodoxin [Methanoculleus taiwanensis]
MHQVLYDSRGGNTKKVADAIAGELGVTAVDVKAASLGPGDGVLFLGSGCYGGKPGEAMVKFIEANDLRGRRVALFGTSGGGAGNEVKGMEAAVKGKGAEVIGRYFCKGQMALFFSRGHPNPADIDAARTFAREMAGLESVTVV